MLFAQPLVAPAQLRILKPRPGAVTGRDKIATQIGVPATIPQIKATPFVQMTVNSDHGRHSDSVQTYIGLSFDVDSILGK